MQTTTKKEISCRVFIIFNKLLFHPFLFFFLSFAVLIIISFSAYSQNSDLVFEHITIENGLSQNHVTCILKDSKGFMWFCTTNGLNRYDGKNFKVYKHSPDNPNSISNNNVPTIYEDKNGTLWIGTYGGGLNKFERKTERFTHYRHDPENNNSISGDFVLSIYEDKSGILWIGTDGSGINKFNRKEESFIRYSHDTEDPNSLSHNIVRSFYEDKGGILWIGTDGGGLNKFDERTGKFTCYKHDPENPKSLSHDFVMSIIEDENGNLWLATSAGLNKFDRNTETFTHYIHDPKNPDSGLQTLFKSFTEPGVIWISTHGIYKFEIKKEKFTYYKHEPYDPTSLSTNITTTIYEDDSGLLWVGTADKGLNKYNKARENILHYKNDPTNANSLSSNIILTIYEDKSGILWIGTDGGGLNKFDRKKGVITHYVHQPDNLNSLSNNKVYSIVEEKPGILWIGTFGGLNRFDTENNKFTIYKHDPNNPRSLSHNIVLVLHIDWEDNFWIGTIGGGLNKFILNGNDKIPPVFTHYKYIPNDPHSIGENNVLAIYEDDDGFLWIGTMGGLNKFDKSKERFFRYQHDPRNPNSLSNNHVSSIYQDKNGVLWIGTEGDGFNKLVPGDNGESSPNFIHYQEKDGLCNNIIYGILEDNHQNLWISTRNGLSEFNPNEVDDKGVVLPSAFKNYYAYDGFQDNEFTSTSYFKNSRGEMFFGGINGFNVFYPDSLKENLTIPAVAITDFKVFNEDYKLDTSITEINQIVLSYNENFFSFDFAVLDYTTPEKNKYAYKMEDVDPNWVFTDASRRFVNYTNLNPGEYVFRVKGANNDGIWNEEGASIKIIILPPWWRTRWAYFFYILFITGTIYLTWKTQLKRLRVKHEFEMSRFEAQKLHEVDELKTRFFTNISHEFRTPLTLILGPAKQLLESINNEEAKDKLNLIHRSAKKLNRLIDELLDISKIESGEMKLKACPINLVSAVKEIVLSFHSLAERKRISFKLNSDEDEIIVYIDKSKLDKILSNVLSNAFKFTPEGGKVEVEVEIISKPPSFPPLVKGELKGGSVEISIRDTGIGISKDHLDKIFDRFYQVDGSHTREHEGTGIGLALTKELVELHKGKIEVESEESKGSTFRIIFPLGKEHLKQEEIGEQECEKDYKKDKEKIIPELDEFLEKKSEHKVDIELSDNPTLLIVEDNPDVRKYICTILESQYRIFEAIDGEEGLNKSFEQIPDLIISDIMMPRLDGFQMCNKLKTDSRTSHIPIILLTAKATMNDKINGLEIGADDYIMKPFEAEELQARIKNLLGQRKRLHDHFREHGLFEIEEQNITSLDQQFLRKAVDIISKQISDSSFGVERLSENLAVSRSLLLKKTEALFGESPNELIKRIRLNKAVRLIEKNFGNISEVALEVGFNNPSYFAECFKKQFGIAPSHYKQNG